MPRVSQVSQNAGPPPPPFRSLRPAPPPPPLPPPDRENAETLPGSPPVLPSLPLPPFVSLEPLLWLQHASLPRGFGPREPRGFAEGAFHSCRSATAGSTPAARRAGSQLATAAIPRMITLTPISTGGSSGCTPNRSAPSQRPRSTAAARPRTRPASATVVPWRRTAASTLRRSAPRARRRPISCVRRVTSLASTP